MSLCGRVPVREAHSSVCRRVSSPFLFLHTRACRAREELLVPIIARANNMRALEDGSCSRWPLVSLAVLIVLIGFALLLRATNAASRLRGHTAEVPIDDAPRSMNLTAAATVEPQLAPPVRNVASADTAGSRNVSTDVCHESIWPPAPPRAQHSPKLPVKSRITGRVLFVLSAYIKNRFHGHALAITLFSLQQQHPNCKVIIVDKASPEPITQLLLPQPRVDAGADRWIAHWFATSIKILRLPRETPNKREYGGYARGLAFLAGAKGPWDKQNFEQFVFMQGSMILSEPVPRVTSKHSAGCQVRAFQLVNKGFSFLRSGVWLTRTREFLTGVGLLGANASAKSLRKVLDIESTSANHNALSASYEGLLQMLSTPDGADAKLPAGGTSVFDHPKAVQKTHGEYLTGLIINRLAQKSCPELQWRAPTSWQHNTPDSGFYKMHGSDFSWIVPADVVISTLLQLADTNQDGRASRSELTDAILSRPSSWSTLWLSTCMAFPFGADKRAAEFVLNGPRPPTGSALAALMARARLQLANRTGQWHQPLLNQPVHASCGRPYDAWFWAETTLNILDMKTRVSARELAITGTLPADINFERTWLDPLNDMYSEAFRKPLLYGDLRRDEAFWGERAPDEVEKQLLRGSKQPATAELRLFSKKLVAGIFSAAANGEAKRGLNFLEMKRLFRRAGFLSSVVVPSCLAFPSVGMSVDPTGAWRVRERINPGQRMRRWTPKHPLPLQVDHNRLANFSFEARLNNTVSVRWVSMAPGQHRMQHWDDMDNGKVMQCLVSAGLLYARASLACLRCQFPASSESVPRTESL